MSFAIISQIKITNLQGSLVHNLRTSSTLNNVDYSKTNKNITLENFKYKSQKDYLEKTKEKISKANKLNKTKNRMCQTGKAFAQEFVFSHSPGAMSEKDSIEFLKEANEFIKNRFPNHEILSSVIHLDETTPHIHIGLSYFDSKLNKFTQKEMMKSEAKLTDINEIRKAFQYEVADKFELKMQDGSVVEAKNHQRTASKQIAELKEAQEKAKKGGDLQAAVLKKLLIKKEEEIKKLEEEKASQIIARERLLTTNNTLIEENEAYKQSIEQSTIYKTSLQEVAEIIKPDFIKIRKQNPDLSFKDQFKMFYNGLKNQNKSLQEQNKQLNDELRSKTKIIDSRPNIDQEEELTAEEAKAICAESAREYDLEQQKQKNSIFQKDITY